MAFWWTVRGAAVVVGALVLYPMLLLLGKIGYSNIPADIYLAEKVQVGPANAIVPSGSALCYSSNRICPMYTTNSGPSSPGAPSCSCWVDNFGDFWGPDQELGSCKPLKKIASHFLAASENRLQRLNRPFRFVATAYSILTAALFL